MGARAGFSRSWQGNGHHEARSIITIGARFAEGNSPWRYLGPPVTEVVVGVDGKEMRIKQSEMVEGTHK